MHTLCLAMIPIFAVLITCISTYVCCRQLRKHLKLFFASPQNDADQSKEKQIDQQLEQVISKHLDDVVAAFKTQIPMASMFIGSAREEKLKEQALNELLKAVPALKEAVVGSPHMVRFTDRLWRSVTYSLMGMSALIGLILGLVEMGILMMCSVA